MRMGSYFSTLLVLLAQGCASTPPSKSSALSKFTLKDASNFLVSLKNKNDVRLLLGDPDFIFDNKEVLMWNYMNSDRPNSYRVAFAIEKNDGSVSSLSFAPRSDEPFVDPKYCLEYFQGIPFKEKNRIEKGPHYPVYVKEFVSPQIKIHLYPDTENVSAIRFSAPQLARLPRTPTGAE